MQKTLLALVITGSALLSPSARAQSISDSDLLWVEPLVTVIPDGTRDTSFKVAIMIDNTTDVGALAIPLSFAGHPHLHIDTSVIYQEQRGISMGPAGRSAQWVIRTTAVNYETQTILIGFLAFHVFEPMRDTLCYVHFRLTGSGTAGSVTLDSTTVGGNHLDLVDALANQHTPTWTPGVVSVFATGDVDCNGVMTLTDIIYMVNFMFRQGPAPMSGCP